MLGGKVRHLPADVQSDANAFGKDPPALTMTWAIWELARHPDVYRKVREEVQKVKASQCPSDLAT
jgi:hypothetical protein